MVSEFTLEGKKYVLMPIEEHEALKLAAEKNERLSRLYSLEESRKRSEELVLKKIDLK
ncbi:MAG: hypothetical protein KAX81_02085 [Leadbetterella sp.]|nr:hypothetical protein [Leadbetterella sp.]